MIKKEKNVWKKFVLLFPIPDWKEEEDDVEKEKEKEEGQVQEEENKNFLGSGDSNGSTTALYIIIFCIVNIIIMGFFA